MKVFTIIDKVDHDLLANYLTDDIDSCITILNEVDNAIVNGEVENCDWQNEFERRCKKQGVKVEELDTYPVLF